MHRKIEFIGGNINSAIRKLGEYNKRGELVYIDFNGIKLYSDTDDVESAYQKITGKTKAEYEAAENKWHEEYQKKQRKHKEAIPELTKKWIKKGNAILDKEYHETWAKCVPNRLNDLYHGMELGATLAIVKRLNAGCKLETAEKIIHKQGHSGMSFGLVCSMVKAFSNRGAEFAAFVAMG